MRRLPSFIALRAFEAAGRLRSFALAGEELRLTPSAISHQIRALEAHFGAALFVRTHRAVSLTPAGSRLLAGLSPAFDAMEAACADLLPAPGPTLAVHCAPSFAAKWLGPRLPGFLDAHPAIALSLSADAEPVDLLRPSAPDLVIAYGVAPEAPGVAIASLGEEEIAALAAPALARTRGQAVLAGATLITSRLSPVRWADWFAHHGLAVPAPRGGPSFDRASLAIAAAVDGMGVVLESVRLAEQELAAGVLVRIDGGRAPMRRAMHFVACRAADRERPKVAAFRDWLLAAARGAPG